MKTLRPIFLTLLFSATAFADRLITTTGKVLEGKVTEEGDGYRIQIDSASMSLAKKFVKQVEIEGDMSNYVPKDDKEKEMLAKGYIKYRGQWMSKDSYQNELKSQLAASKKKLEEIKSHQVWGSEWKKETRHFEFHSNASPEILDNYAELFETFYDVYSSKFSIKLSPTMERVKMKINIFRDEASYQEYAQHEGTAGYFSPSARELNLYHDYEEPDYSQMVLFHEGTHLINYLVNPEMFGVIPIWLEESTAEYFSNVRIERKTSKVKILPGEIAEDRLGVAQEMIATGKAIPLEKLLTTPQVGFDADYYAFGWSFVHFMMNHPKYSKGFLSFYTTIYSGKGLKFDKTGDGKSISNEEVIKSLVKFIGAKDLATVEKEWIAYVRDNLKVLTGRGYYYRAMMSDWKVKKKGGKEGGDTKVGESTDVIDLLNKAIDQLGFKVSQAYFLRSMIWGMRGKDKNQLADINAAIDLNPTNPRYYFTRAWLSNKDDKYKEAENDLRVAIALDPLEPRYEDCLGKLLKKKWNSFYGL